MKFSLPNKLTDLKWLNLFGVDYEARNGKKSNWVFASRKEMPNLGESPLVPDAVVIIPILVGQPNKLVMIKEFRIPLGDYEYGFPAGLIDKGENPLVCAKRELKEETGLDVTEVLHVSPVCVSSAGLSDESVVYVVCECSGNPSLEGNEISEDIEVQILDLDEVNDLYNSQNKISAKAIPFLMHFNINGEIFWGSPIAHTDRKIPFRPKQLGKPFIPSKE